MSAAGATKTIDVALEGTPGLVHADLSEPGYGRRRHGRGFMYLEPDGSRLDDRKAIAHCRALVIPPAWQSVWIGRATNGHILCTGLDDRARKQYLYHPLWNEWRNRRKFASLVEFASTLHRVRDAIDRDLKGARVSRRRVVAAAVRLVDQGLVRVGNEAYVRDNHTFGATTLRNRHVETEPDGAITLEFTGKSNTDRHIVLEDPALARSLRYCADLPGQRLFQYRDGDGALRPVTSSDVNAYLRAASGLDDVSAKDFRTWGGTVAAWQHADAHRHDPPPKPAVKAARHAAETLGNTLTVARKYYVHPDLLKAIDAGETPPRAGRSRKQLDVSESSVLRWLESL